MQKANAENLDPNKEIIKGFNALTEAIKNFWEVLYISFWEAYAKEGFPYGYSDEDMYQWIRKR